MGAVSRSTQSWLLLETESPAQCTAGPGLAWQLLQHVGCRSRSSSTKKLLFPSVLGTGFSAKILTSVLTWQHTKQTDRVARSVGSDEPAVHVRGTSPGAFLSPSVQWVSLDRSC